ncbi:hypothetical protein LWI28_023222 [Acer negundo]|uniref:RING-type E3 ubiquitin transferase n=1 Tax=Acer negundo TaxID=4023 RepID=A0AAD5IS28_ACENE|nr:hypothetical protein LWI28_023222 [Acer negundo]
MGLPQNPSTPPPHLYPQALQLKLYQAFIFSIPVLFSVILILLFYLFYLKRRASILSSSAPPILPTTSNQASPYIHHSMGWNVDTIGKLPIVLFDEELKSRDTQCCVCLGEFEIKEELLQVPSCKHVFHVDCLNHWLQSNRTCPLCRCCIIPITKLHIPPPSPPPPTTTTVSESQQQDHNNNSNQNHQQNISSLEHHQQLDDDGRSNADNFCREHLTIPIEGSSSESNA